ncbi:Protein SRJ-14 [Aphelenchoides avenae]|nr:Protein SRJ-14 [Aphelenchus avenae]
MDSSSTTGLSLRDIHHYNERVASVLSLVLNGILSYLLITEKNETLKPYSRILLQNAIVDVIYVFACLAVEFQVELNNGVMIFIVNGYFKEWPIEWHYLLIWIWITVMTMTVQVVPIEFFFRYMLVVKKKLLNIWEMLGCCSIAFLLGAWDATLCVLACMQTPNPHEDYGDLMQHPMWFDRNGTQTTFLAADRSQPFLLLFIFSGTTMDIGAYTLMLLLSLKTHGILVGMKGEMSAKTSYMQKQMNRILAAEALSVLCISITPVAIFMMFLFFRWTIVGSGLVLTMIMAWIPIINPITKILLVGPYRRRVLPRACLSIEEAQMRRSTEKEKSNSGSNKKPSTSITTSKVAPTPQESPQTSN